MKKFICMPLLFTATLIVLFSCKKDPRVPTAEFTFTVNGNIVTFQSTVTDAITLEWNFGDNSPASSDPNPSHTFPEFLRDYIVTLKVTGDGGEASATHTVSIPAMTKIEMLTGGPADTDGKKWKLSSTEASYIANADATFTILETIPGGSLTLLGFSTIYQDEFTFKHDGTFTMTPKGSGLPASLMYCTANNIPNVPPGTVAQQAGLTLITPFTAPASMTFALNEAKTLVIPVTTDLVNLTNMNYSDVTTLSFSSGGFLEFRDWITECLVMEIAPDRMKVVYFVSRVPVNSPLVGKTTNTLIFTFVSD